MLDPESRIMRSDISLALMPRFAAACPGIVFTSHQQDQVKATGELDR